jgi:hypothetical protein
LYVSGRQRDDDFVETHNDYPSCAETDLPAELGKGVVDHEIMAPVEEARDYEVTYEDRDGHKSVEGEGENAPALAESHVFCLVGN